MNATNATMENAYVSREEKEARILDRIRSMRSQPVGRRQISQPHRPVSSSPEAGAVVAASVSSAIVPKSTLDDRLVRRRSRSRSRSRPLSRSISLGATGGSLEVSGDGDDHASIVGDETTGRMLHDLETTRTALVSKREMKESLMGTLAMMAKEHQRLKDGIESSDGNTNGEETFNHQQEQMQQHHYHDQLQEHQHQHPQHQHQHQQHQLQNEKQKQQRQQQEQFKRDTAADSFKRIIKTRSNENVPTQSLNHKGVTRKKTVAKNKHGECTPLLPTSNSNTFGKKEKDSSPLLPAYDRSLSPRCNRSQKSSFAVNNATNMSTEGFVDMVGHRVLREQKEASGVIQRKRSLSRSLSRRRRSRREEQTTVMMMTVSDGQKLSQNGDTSYCHNHVHSKKGKTMEAVHGNYNDAKEPWRLWRWCYGASAGEVFLDIIVAGALLGGEVERSSSTVMTNATIGGDILSTTGLQHSTEGNTISSMASLFGTMILNEWEHCHQGIVYLTLRFVIIWILWTKTVTHMYHSSTASQDGLSYYRVVLLPFFISGIVLVSSSDTFTSAKEDGTTVHLFLVYGAMVFHVTEIVIYLIQFLGDKKCRGAVLVRSAISVLQLAIWTYTGGVFGINSNNSCKLIIYASAFFSYLITPPFASLLVKSCCSSVLENELAVHLNPSLLLTRLQSLTATTFALSALDLMRCHYNEGYGSMFQVAMFVLLVFWLFCGSAMMFCDFGPLLHHHIGSRLSSALQNIVHVIAIASVLLLRKGIVCTFCDHNHKKYTSAAIFFCGGFLLLSAILTILCMLRLFASLHNQVSEGFFLAIKPQVVHFIILAGSCVYATIQFWNEIKQDDASYSVLPTFGYFTILSMFFNFGSRNIYCSIESQMSQWETYHIVHTVDKKDDLMTDSAHLAERGIKRTARPPLEPRAEMILRAALEKATKVGSSPNDTKEFHRVMMKAAEKIWMLPEEQVEEEIQMLRIRKLEIAGVSLFNGNFFS